VFTRARWEHAAPAIAAVLTTPGALASHSTAAVLRDIPLLLIPQRSCVSVVPWHTGDIARVHVHRCRSAPMSVPLGAVECCRVERTAIDIAREHGVVAGVVALDHILREQMTDLGRMNEELKRCTRWPGVVSAREAVSLANPLSESPLESQSRLKFIAFGLPAPQPQAPIADAGGRFIGRVDFYWDEFGVVGEADGALKYGGIEGTPLYGEKLRQEDLEDTGLIVVRWGSADLRRFDAVAERLRRAFARGARREGPDRRWRVLPSTPAHFDPARLAGRPAERAWQGQSR
jgi:hypothetical protein